MTVLLTLASVLGAGLLLSVLCAGLLLIVKPLQSVRGYLEQIAMGVRAIETHGRTLPHTLSNLIDQLEPLGDELQRAGERLGTAAQTLEARNDRAD